MGGECMELPTVSLLEGAVRAGVVRRLAARRGWRDQAHEFSFEEHRVKGKVGATRSTARRRFGLTSGTSTTSVTAVAVLAGRQESVRGSCDRHGNSPDQALLLQRERPWMCPALVAL
jgi:hypothetical protein